MGASTPRWFRPLAFVLFVAGSVAPAFASQEGELPVSASLQAGFNCARGSVQLAVQHQGESVRLSSLSLDGKPASQAASDGVKKAMKGFTRVTGMSARCGRETPSIVLLLEGHASTQAARAANGLDDDDVGMRLIFQGGALRSADAFPLD
ncbi:hypothetical protein ACMGDH_15545 [Sphingomonas sp. DT-207]|uniref:hypothetical protein n=1 Tax=Sphingomonas sp. DT-207 TaxID=3396167 RepID=UPI003F1974E2